MKDLAFKWKKTKTNRSILIEKHDIKSQRETYLTLLRQYKAEGRPIIYEDETYIHSSHATPKSWTDDSNLGLRTSISKGERLIIVHAGGRYGFVPNALLVCKSKQKTGDYHQEMNTENYVKWLRSMLITNLLPNSVLVIDNASYHNTQIDKPPTSNSLKTDIISLLTKHNIPFDMKLSKSKLYDMSTAVVLRKSSRFQT